MTVSITQSTSYVAVFKAYLASDHVTEATGKTIAITISKAGGAFGNPNAGATNATEISSGWYKVTLDTTDTNTLGAIAIRGAVATIDDVGIWYNVTTSVASDITAIKTKTDFLPSATAGAAGGLFIAGTNAATTITTSLTTTFTGNLTGSVASVTGLTASNLDATISSRMATYTQPTGFLAATFPTGTVANTTNITAGTITTVSGNVTGSVGSVVGAVGSVTGAVGSVTGAVGSVTGLTASDVGAIKLKTDLIPGTQDGYTFAETTLLMASTLLGKASGMGTATGVFRALDDSQDRVTATIDASGNRTAVTRDTSSP